MEVKQGDKKARTERSCFIDSARLSTLDWRSSDRRLKDVHAMLLYGCGRGRRSGWRKWRLARSVEKHIVHRQ